MKPQCDGAFFIVNKIKKTSIARYFSICLFYSSKVAPVKYRGTTVGKAELLYRLSYFLYI